MAPSLVCLSRDWGPGAGQSRRFDDNFVLDMALKPQVSSKKEGSVGDVAEIVEEIGRKKKEEEKMRA